MGPQVRAIDAPGSSGLLGLIPGSTDQIVSYRGFTLRETASATALVYIRQGGSSGLILDVIGFAANAAVSDYYSLGIRCEGDIYYDLSSGTVEGTIRYG